MRQQPNRSHTYLTRAIDRINSTFPGGISCMLSEYRKGAISLSDITAETGVRFRALRRVFDSLGASRRDVGQSLKLAWAGDSERKAATSVQAKATLASPEIQAKSRIARRSAQMKDPTKHVNAKVKKSKYETMVAEALAEAGFTFSFNKPFPPFWLDFWLPDLAIGIEVQRLGKHPSRDRDLHFRAAGVRAVFYFHTFWVKRGLVGDLIKVIGDVQSGSLDPSSLGEYTMISRKPHGRAFVEVNGNKFRWPFGTMRSGDMPPPPAVSQHKIAA